MTAIKGTHMSDNTIHDRTVGYQAERARESDPRYFGRQLVRVVRATNQAEGEFVQGLLLSTENPIDASSLPDVRRARHARRRSARRYSPGGKPRSGT
jgi:hypothetical protein